MYIRREKGPGNVCKYLCESTSDINNLPKFGVMGTQGTNASDDEPCNYDSSALVVTGSSTEVYKLMPSNNWRKM